MQIFFVMLLGLHAGQAVRPNAKTQFFNIKCADILVKCPLLRLSFVPDMRKLSKQQADAALAKKMEKVPEEKGVENPVEKENVQDSPLKKITMPYKVPNVIIRRNSPKWKPKVPKKILKIYNSAHSNSAVSRTLAASAFYKNLHVIPTILEKRGVDLNLPNLGNLTGNALEIVSSASSVTGDVLASVFPCLNAVKYLVTTGGSFAYDAYYGCKDISLEFCEGTQPDDPIGAYAVFGYIPPLKIDLLALYYIRSLEGKIQEWQMQTYISKLIGKMLPISGGGKVTELYAEPSLMTEDNGINIVHYNKLTVEQRRRQQTFDDPNNTAGGLHACANLPKLSIFGKVKGKGGGWVKSFMGNFQNTPVADGETYQRCFRELCQFNELLRILKKSDETKTSEGTRYGLTEVNDMNYNKSYNSDATQLQPSWYFTKIPFTVNKFFKKVCDSPDKGEKEEEQKEENKFTVENIDGEVEHYAEEEENDAPVSSQEGSEEEVPNDSKTQSRFARMRNWR